MAKRKAGTSGISDGERGAAPVQAKRKGGALGRESRKPRDEEKVRIFQDIMTRIRMVTGTRTQVELAAFLEIQQSSVSDSSRRYAVPPQWYLTLLTKLGVNPRWLEHGTGPQYILGARRCAAEEEDAAAGPASTAAARLGTCQVVRVHSTRCPPPEPGAIPPLSVAGEIALPREWLPPSLVLLRLEADAGLPYFSRGAYVGVDTACVQPLPGEYYAVFLPGGGLGMAPLKAIGEKRHAAAVGNKVTECPADHILGRVLWVWRPF